ncbi:MAG: hypothetical protein AAGB34_07240, partial [Planctomycetota bacterium]
MSTRSLLVAALCAAPAHIAIAGTADIFLDDFTQDHPIIVERFLGELNFLQDKVDFSPFPNDPIPVLYPRPIGDRLGYDAVGLGDVDGDGFNDWAATWYHAEPVKSSGVARIEVDDVVIPGSPFPTPNDITTGPPMERVGFVRVFSGKDNSQIGGEIWGGRDDDRVVHEIATLDDIDGDGQDEVVMSSNLIGHINPGSIMVFSCTNKYNTDGSQDQRWVCIWQINGTTTTTELGYFLEDTFVDFDGNGQDDIAVASKFHSVSGGRSNSQGAGWIFLTPSKCVFEHIQQNPLWDKDPGREVKVPLVMFSDDASFYITKKNGHTSGLDLQRIAPAGDIDDDGIDDLVAKSEYIYTPQGDSTTGLYFLLSFNGYDQQSNTLATSVPKYTLQANDGSG